MNPAIEQVLRSHGISPTACLPSKHSPHVMEVAVPGEKAFAIWNEYRRRFPETGIWPILRGDFEDEIDSFPSDLAEILAQVPAGSIDEILAPRFAERLEFSDQFIDEPTPPDIDAATFALKMDASGAMSFGGNAKPAQPWPSSPPTEKREFHSLQSYRTGKPYPQVRLALIQLQHPYEAPAYLNFGGWNGSPGPEIQVAMLREWQRTHGAFPAAITGDVLECVVERPPQTESDAMKLAVQQWLFCDDIVSQGTQSVRKLAIEIWRSPIWFFWWD